MKNNKSSQTTDINILIHPTINMKEAMNAINSMFREPLESVPIGRKAHEKHFVERTN